MRRASLTLLALLGLVPLLGSGCTAAWSPIDELAELESLSTDQLLVEVGERHGAFVIG